MTHAELVERAARWLRGTMRCGVVLTECVGAGCEIPDAMGWQGAGHSILVECKTSREDFRADAKKAGRAANTGPGCCRFYMAREGVIDPHALPGAWGLVTIGGGRTARAHVVVTPEHRTDAEWRRPREIGILLSELRKVQIVQGGGSLFPSKAAERVGRCLGVDVPSRAAGIT